MAAGGPTILIPEYPSPEEVSELVSLMKERSSSRDGTISTIADEILIETAQIVAVNKHSGDTAIEQYNWFAKTAWIVDGKVMDRGPFWGEHLIQNSVAIHEYATRYLRPALTGKDDTDSTVREYLGVRVPKIERAKTILEHIESDSYVNGALEQLTGNTPLLSKAERVSNLLDLMYEIRLEKKLSDPRVDPREIAEIVCGYYSHCLIRSTVVLGSSLPETFLSAHLPEIQAKFQESPRECAIYINKRVFELEYSVFADITTLELQGTGLRVLPRCLGKFFALQKINLNWNKISSLPETIGNLRLLEEFTIAENRLRSLPASFGELTSLKKLDLNDNHLRSLPSSFSHLRELESLSLLSSGLKKLPSYLNTFPHVEHFELPDIPFSE